MVPSHKYPYFNKSCLHINYYNSDLNPVINGIIIHIVKTLNSKLTQFKITIQPITVEMNVQQAVHKTSKSSEAQCIAQSINDIKI